MATGYLAGPDDFLVEELSLYPPTGEGGHTFVFVEKRLLETDDVARVLAAAADVPARDIGYAGRKDRVAVARQCFSVPGLPVERALAIEHEGLKVLWAVPHPHKLRTGQLAGNRFEIRVRGVAPAAVEGLAARQAEIERVGMTNRFGAQRFGRDQANVALGQRILAQGHSGKDRRRARFVVSALQSAVFNEVLARRDLPLDRVECGDVARKEDSGGLFRVEDEALDNERAARFEISATGPIFGTKMEAPAGAVAAREQAVMREFGIDPDVLRAPRGIRLRGGRRPFRVRVGSLEVETGPEDVAEGHEIALRFSLPSGSYATTVMEELLGFQPVRRPFSPQDTPRKAPA